MKKLFVNFIFLLLIAALVFFVGWVQFSVKPGFCGIMTSKTGGLYPEPIENGHFLWRWEKLIPTNANITTFSLEPCTFSKSVSGSLPSAQIYSKQLNPSPDFSYNIQADISLSLSPKQILALVRDKGIENQEDLESYLEGKAGLVAQKTVDFLLNKDKSYTLTSPVSFSEEELKSFSAAYTADFSDFTLVSVNFTLAKIPDMKMYKSAVESFSLYKSEVDAQLKVLAKNQAQVLVQENRSMQQLEKFADLISKYPQLEELSKSANFTDIINALNNAR